MNNLFLAVLAVLTVSLITFLLWVLLPHWKRLKRSHNNTENYYQLKYQLQYYVAIFTALIAVFSILGYDKYEDIQQKIKADILKQTDSIVKVSTLELDDKLRETLKLQTRISIENEIMKERNEQISTRSERTNDRFYELLNDFIYFKRDLTSSTVELQSQIKNVESAGQRLATLKNDIEAIKKVDFLNQIHLVPDLYFEPTDIEKTTDTVYFKELLTLSKTELPDFRTPPSLIMSPYTGMTMMITKVTSQYYVVRGGGGIQWDEESNIDNPKNWRYDLLIIYKDSRENP